MTTPTTQLSRYFFCFRTHEILPEVRKENRLPPFSYFFHLNNKDLQTAMIDASEPSLIPEGQTRIDYTQVDSLYNVEHMEVITVKNSLNSKNFALKMPKIEREYSNIKNEWTLLKSLQGSEHVIEATALFWIQKTPCLLLPIYSSDLADFVNLQGLFELKDVIVTAKKILNALAFLKSRGIVHRDIKPANILVSRNEMKLADFGLAFSINESSPQENEGTLRYFSPERVLDLSYGDFSSDLWAALCTIIETYISTLFKFKTHTQLIEQQQSLLKEKYPEELVQQLNVKMKPIIRKIPVNSEFISLSDRIQNKSQENSEEKELEPFKHFLKASLILDPSKRPSVEKILTDPFIQ